jgi:hypothetical protein
MLTAAALRAIAGARTVTLETRAADRRTRDGSHVTGAAK